LRELPLATVFPYLFILPEDPRHLCKDIVHGAGFPCRGVPVTPDEDHPGLHLFNPVNKIPSVFRSCQNDISFPQGPFVQRTQLNFVRFRTYQGQHAVALYPYPDAVTCPDLFPDMRE
jgi:hypothetical protein